jgi:hypothetical protein
MIYLTELKTYTEHYAHLALESLTITARLRPGAPLAAYDPVYLDNLLARAVVEQATGQRGLPRSDEPYRLPLPLELAWESPDNLPLWTSSVFLPMDEAIQDTFYRHKRPIPSHFADARKVKPGVGRWMERRVPVPVVTCGTWQARCIGNAEAIRELLVGIAFIGKERRIGFGEIAEWLVEPGEFSAHEVFIQNGKLAHALPCQAEIGIVPVGPTTLVGWTPPEWLPALFAEGWPIGTAVEDLHG